MSFTVIQRENLAGHLDMHWNPIIQFLWDSGYPRLLGEDKNKLQEQVVPITP